MSLIDSFKENGAPVVNNLIIINVLMLIGSSLFPQFETWLGMWYWESERFNLVQVITYMFMHADFSHLFFNMFAVYMFGSVVERFWGSRRFLFYYLVTGVGAAIVQQLVWTGVGMTNSVTVGASGAVFGLLLAFGWLFPEQRLVMLFFPIPIKARVFVTLYALAELFMGLRANPFDNVAHFAHLGGMIFGALLILYWKRKGRLYQ